MLRAPGSLVGIPTHDLEMPLQQPHLKNCDLLFVRQLITISYFENGRSDS